MKKLLVFHAGQLYGEYVNLSYSETRALPDDALIYAPADTNQRYWYRKDITPMLLEDVPGELRALALLLT